MFGLYRPRECGRTTLVVLVAWGSRTSEGIHVVGGEDAGAWGHAEGAYGWLEGALADVEVCRRAAEGAEVVFHQAAIPSVPRSVREPLQSHASGPTATLHMLEAARQAGVRRFLFAASSSAYGETEELPKHEAMYPVPLSPYAAGKLAGEHYVTVY